MVGAGVRHRGIFAGSEHETKKKKLQHSLALQVQSIIFFSHQIILKTKHNSTVLYNCVQKQMCNFLISQFFQHSFLPFLRLESTSTDALLMLFVLTNPSVCYTVSQGRRQKKVSQKNGSDKKEALIFLLRIYNRFVKV